MIFGNNPDEKSVFFVNVLWVNQFSPNGFLQNSENLDSNSSDFPTPDDVLKALSNSNKKHIKRHLSDFQQLDPKLNPTITEQSLQALGTEIVRPENLVGSPNADQLKFDKVIDINGNPTKVRAVLNREGKLRSVHIRHK